MTAVCTWPSGEILGAPDRDELIEARPFQLAQWAMDYQGDPTRKLLLITLALKANSHGVTWVGQDTLAEACCVTICTVGRHLAVLEAENMIRRYHRYELNGRKKSRNSDVTMMAPCLPATYLAKCVVGPTRENASEDLPSTSATLHGCEVDSGPTSHERAVDLTSANDLPSTGATLHPCNDLPRVGAPDLPSTGAGVSISKEDLEEGSITPPVEQASLPDRRSGEDGVGTVSQLFDCGGLSGKLAERVAIDHDGEALWFDTPADAVYGLWRVLNGKRVTAVFSEKRRKRVEDCLAVLGLNRCLDAVRGNTVSEFHLGDNDRGGRRFDDLAMIFGSIDDAERFERYWIDPPSRANGMSRRKSDRRAPGQHHGPTGVLPDLDAYDEMARTWGKRR